ncbi:hypothetical protein PRIPAC_89727 [Pristionchus pacificus]|uniref:Uncharacterized protein n=1 Tax=Pristionchus pacificus TaxID=54126 RepID=A0A2A6BZ47_PRIPA|nr:hypothetical protein PRIPAC_89727 [Pristionchus pacificus]|eukprot:PDM71158.1 hypothetical protein PRIPAC_43541 [Pristionchus pacificus]
MDAILDSYRTHEAALILQSSESSPKPSTEPAPLGILIVITVISVVLVVSGFIIIAMILDPSTSLVEDEVQEEDTLTFEVK